MSPLRLSALAASVCAALLGLALLRRQQGPGERPSAAAGPAAEGGAAPDRLRTGQLAAAPAGGEVADVHAAGPSPSSRVPVAPPARAPERVEVLVADSVDRPVAGMTVEARGPLKHPGDAGGTSASEETDGEGLAVFGLDPGLFVVSLARDEASYKRFVQVSRQHTERVVIHLRQDLSLDLLPMPPTAILGQVVDPWGAPVEAKVVARPAARPEHQVPATLVQSSGYFVIKELEPGGVYVLQATHHLYDASAEVIARGGDGDVTLQLGRRTTVGLRILGHDGEPYHGPATVSSEPSGLFPEREVAGPHAELLFSVAEEYRLRVRVDPLYLSDAFTARRRDELAVRLELAATLASSPDQPLPDSLLIVRGEGRYERRVLSAHLQDGIAVPPGVVEVEFPGGQVTLLRIAAGERGELKP